MYAQRPKDSLYTDTLVYSPDCPVFRDDTTGGLLHEPWLCSFITAAAPNAGVAQKRGCSRAEIEAALERRADRVLAVAAERGHRCLVLGAWGCGVFRNDPTVVAATFAGLLARKYKGSFSYVSFACIGPEANRAAFERQFGQQQLRIRTAPTAGAALAATDGAHSAGEVLAATDGAHSVAGVGAPLPLPVSTGLSTGASGLSLGDEPSHAEASAVIAEEGGGTTGVERKQAFDEIRRTRRKERRAIGRARRASQRHFHAWQE